jgi:cytochrome c553
MNFKKLLVALLYLPLTVLADAEAGREKAQVCAACHGIDGNSIAPQYPNLSGQTARYIYLQLKDFKRGRRNNPLMSPMALNLSKQDMNDLADWYASQTYNGQNSKNIDADLGKGKKLADAALCTMCHAGGFTGQNEMPRLAGQHYEYLIKQLKDFKVKHRTNDAGNMTAVVRTIPDEDLEDIAAYISTQQ